MTKKKIGFGVKKAKSATAAISPPSSPEDKEWKTKSDADDIRRYAQIRADKPRHGRAMSHLRQEFDGISDLDDDTGPEQPRFLARSGRKASARGIGRRA